MKGANTRVPTTRAWHAWMPTGSTAPTTTSSAGSSGQAEAEEYIREGRKEITLQKRDEFSTCKIDPLTTDLSIGCNQFANRSQPIHQLVATNFWLVFDQFRSRS